MFGIEICYFYSETTNVKCIHACIIHRNIIVIELKPNEKMNPEEHYPQNSESHCIISYWIQITLHYFQCRSFALRSVQSDLSLVILKTRTCLLTYQFLTFNYSGSQLAKVWKKVILVLFWKVDKISNVSEKTIYPNTSCTISFKRTIFSPFISVKTFADLLALWCWDKWWRHYSQCYKISQ